MEKKIKEDIIKDGWINLLALGMHLYEAISKSPLDEIDKEEIVIRINFTERGAMDKNAYGLILTGDKNGFFDSEKVGYLEGADEDPELYEDGEYDFVQYEFYE